MQLEWLRPVVDAGGPFLTVSLDVTRDGPDGAKEVQLRWRAHEERLRAQGAVEPALAAAREAVTTRTGRGGPQGRFLVANADGVQLDLLLPEPPVREESQWGPVPHLLPVARAGAGTRYAVVELSSDGADIEVHGAPGSTQDHDEVVGGHDLLHAVPTGGWSARRYRARVEESWERGATAVADAVQSVVRRHDPELVVVRGVDRVVADLLSHLGPPASERVVHVTGAGAAGGDHALERADVTAALTAHAARRREDVLGRFQEGEQHQDLAVEGLSSVVQVLRRGEVEELLLQDDPSSTLQLWVGSTPGAVAETAAELGAAGEASPVQVPADTALLWGLVTTGGGLTLVGGRQQGPVERDLVDDAASDPASRAVDLTDGVGALLRHADAAAPHAGAASTPGRGEPATRRV